MTHDDKNFDAAKGGDIPKEMIDIWELRIPVPIYNSLYRAGWRTIGDLSRLSQWSLIKQARLTPKRRYVVLRALADWGIFLPVLLPEEYDQLSPEELERATKRYRWSFPEDE